MLFPHYRTFAAIEDSAWDQMAANTRPAHTDMEPNLPLETTRTDFTYEQSKKTPIQEIVFKQLGWYRHSVRYHQPFPPVTRAGQSQLPALQECRGQVSTQLLTYPGLNRWNQLLSPTTVTHRYIHHRWRRFLRTIRSIFRI